LLKWKKKACFSNLNKQNLLKPQQSTYTAAGKRIQR